MFIFGLFKQTIQFLQQINVKKCPSSIRRWDSNPRPLERESTPITTRPGLPPKAIILNCRWIYRQKAGRPSFVTECFVKARFFKAMDLSSFVLQIEITRDPIRDLQRFTYFRYVLLRLFLKKNAPQR